MRYLNIFGFLCFFLTSCSFPTTEEAGIKYKTVPAIEAPDNLKWEKIGSAKELINAKEKLVVVSGGDNPISDEEWDDFQPRYPWTKNMDRHLLIDKTVLLRSPGAKADCKSTACLTFINYRGYSWVELAAPLSVDFVPEKTNMLKPEKGHLAIKTIKKCQAVCFEKEIYQLSDGKGNLYAMHATEAGRPNLDVELPDGWTLEKVNLDEPLIIMPFGEKDDCYFNIVGDHLGQGYHQYQYADEYYPSE